MFEIFLCWRVLMDIERNVNCLPTSRSATSFNEWIGEKDLIVREPSDRTADQVCAIKNKNKANIVIISHAARKLV